MPEVGVLAALATIGGVLLGVWRWATSKGRARSRIWEFVKKADQQAALVLEDTRGVPGTPTHREFEIWEAELDAKAKSPSLSELRQMLLDANRLLGQMNAAGTNLNRAYRPPRAELLKLLPKIVERIASLAP